MSTTRKNVRATADDVAAALAARKPDTRTEEEVAMGADAVMERRKRGKDWEIIQAQLSGVVFDHRREGDASDDDMRLLN